MKIILWIILIILETVSVIFLETITFDVLIDKKIFIDREMIPHYYQDITLIFRFIIVVTIYFILNIAFVRNLKWYIATVCFYIAGLVISVLWSNYFINFWQMTAFVVLVVIVDIIPFIIFYSIPFMKEGRRINNTTKCP
jgi:hypothetical protein